MLFDIDATLLDMLLYHRADSGFVSPKLYEVLEDRNCKYAIRLKENTKLRELAEDKRHCTLQQNSTRWIMLSNMVSSYIR